MRHTLPKTARIGTALLVTGWVGLSSASPGAEEKLFAFAIERGALARGDTVIRVRQGDTVKLHWTADETAVLHLHGYKLEAVVEPGKTAELVVRARASGRFPIHLHRPAAQPAPRVDHHGAPLVTLEVHPK